MIEIRDFFENVVTENPTDEQILKAIQDERNKRVELVRLEELQSRLNELTKEASENANS